MIFGRYIVRLGWWSLTVGVRFFDVVGQIWIWLDIFLSLINVWQLSAYGKQINNVHNYTYVYIRMCIYVCVYMYVYIRMCIYICVYTYVYIRMYVEPGSNWLINMLIQSSLSTAFNLVVLHSLATISQLIQVRGAVYY